MLKDFEHMMTRILARAATLLEPNSIELLLFASAHLLLVHVFTCSLMMRFCRAFKRCVNRFPYNVVHGDRESRAIQSARLL